MAQGLGAKTLRSFSWAYLGYILGKSSTFITTIILARLLTPAQFGIIAFATTAIATLDAVRDLGVSLAIIQRRDRVDEASTTAFWLTLASNLIAWIVLVAVAPSVATFFQEPLINDVLPILSLTFIINGLGAVHDARLQREMQFGRRMIPTLAGSIVKGVVSITLALTGFGVWALVFGQISGQTTYTGVIWRLTRWHPKLAFDMALAGELLAFGYKIIIDSTLSMLQTNIDYIFIGRLLGETALGVYTIAYRVPELIIINMCNVIANVLFPAYASIQEDRPRLRRTLLLAMRYIALVTVPVGVGLALISPLFVSVFFPPVWAEAGRIMAVLSLYGILIAITWNIGDIYKAIDRVDILWKTAVLEFVILAPVLFVLAQDSAFAVAVGHVCVAFVTSVLRLVIVVRLLGMDIRRIMAQFLSPVAGAALMSILVSLWLSLGHSMPSLVQLTLAVIVGALAYIGSLWYTERNLVIRVYNWLQRTLTQQEAVA